MKHALATCAALVVALAAFSTTGCSSAPAQWNPPEIFGPANEEPKPSGPSDPTCPDGTCPNYQSPVGSPIEATQPPAPINSEALNEVKGAPPQTCTGANCRPRPPAVTYAPMYRAKPRYHPRAIQNGTVVTVPGRAPVYLNPGEIFLGFVQKEPESKPPPAAIPPMPALTDAPARQPATAKTGTFHCRNCNKPTVGEQWHEVWAADGTPLTCLCDACWQALDPQDRAKHLRAHAAQNLDTVSPLLGAMIREAASEDQQQTRPPAKLPSYGTEF